MVGFLATPTAANAAPATNCAEPGVAIGPIPWAQQTLTPERVWPVTRGGGITIAVLASGVDANHPQLSGRVDRGFDAVAGSGTADDDCLGVGTQIAGVIAAQQAASVGLLGLAPRSRILPIRVIAESTTNNPISQQVLARGIDAATTRGAKVIVVGVAAYTGGDALRSAVTRAVASGAIVVAAVGDRGATNDGNPPSFPAGYGNVLGVGAVGPTGERWDGSQYGPDVDLVAPGAEVVTLQRGSGMTVVNGTGVAAGFVGATIALTRAKRSDLTSEDLVQLLLATTSPAPIDPGYGAGMVNPYGAVNDQVLTSSPVPLPAVPGATQTRATDWTRSRAVIGTVAALGGVLLILVVSVALPRGRRRLWRSRVAPTPVRHVEPTEPGPPVLLFDDR
jgi:hypothetical protein